MVKESEIRNLWLLNINSESGTAIGKCGSKGSSISDLDIVAGFITAIHQLSQEMVTSDEVSNYSWEDIKGGAKRVTLYSTWGNEVSFKSSSQDRIPIITSMLQISGPKMSEYEYNVLLRLLRFINDEIVYRYMMGELTKERVIDPIITIDIINNVLKNFDFTKKGRLIGVKSIKLEKLIDKTLINVLKNDANVIDTILSKLPLEYTCIQEDYAEKVNETVRFIREEIKEFRKVEKMLNFFRQEKIYNKKDSFSILREEYNQFLDSQEGYFEKKRALAVALEEWHSILDDMLFDLQGSLKNQELQKIQELQNDMPRPDLLDNFMTEIKNEVFKQKDSIILTKLERKIHTDLSNLNDIKFNKNLNKYNQWIPKLKNGYETIFSLISENVNYEIEKELETFYNFYDQIKNKEIQYKDDVAEKPVIYKDVKVEIRRNLTILRKNLVVKVINSLYDEIFNSYRKFKLVLVYPGDVKTLIVEKTINQLKSFINRIQDYNFAAILEKLIKLIKPDNLVKVYCLNLLESYLQNYIYNYFIKNPFLRDDKKPLIALDSYSLKFCSELINETGLNKDIYKEIEKMKLSQKFKEKFIQILDHFVLTRDSVIKELKNSRDLFNSWYDKVDNMINRIDIQESNTTASKFINYCLTFTRLKGKDESKSMKKNFYIKETIFKNIEPSAKLIDEIINNLSKKSEIKKIIDELEKSRKSTTPIFNKREYFKLFNDSKSLLSNELKNDKADIKKLINNISNLIDDEEATKLNQLLNNIKNVRQLLRNDEKLKSFQEELKDIIKADVFNGFLDTFESLDNEYLNLEGFNHIKGIIKTVASSEPLIKESNIEKKHKSRELLMEALIETYAYFFEDYFGKFTFHSNGKLDLKKLNIIIKPGRLFNKQYEKSYDQLQFQIGLNSIQTLFKNVLKNKNKFKSLKIDFLMNYLVDYYNKKNCTSSKEFIKSFSSPKSVDKFIDFLVNKLTTPKQIEALKVKADKFYKELARYCARKIKKKPILPIELNIFKDDIMNTLINIYNNINEGDVSYYLEGKHPKKDHPSRRYNFKKIPPKKFEQLCKDINTQFINDLNILKRIYSYKPKIITPKNKIVENISNNLKETLKKETEKYGFSDLVFENFNRIRIVALLNKFEYELPNDIKIKLIQEGKYNKNGLKIIIKLSKKINELLRMTMNASLSKDPVFNELLNKKLNKENGGFIEYNIDVPDAIISSNLDIIFGRDAVWSKGKQKLIGFKLPFDSRNKNTFGEAMRSSVYQDVFNELKPVIKILNKYSREIHTGFDTVYKKLYE